MHKEIKKLGTRVIGGDGRARLTDFGCVRASVHGAHREEQGPALPEVPTWLSSPGPRQNSPRTWTRCRRSRSSRPPRTSCPTRSGRLGLGRRGRGGRDANGRGREHWDEMSAIISEPKRFAGVTDSTTMKIKSHSRLVTKRARNRNRVTLKRLCLQVSRSMKCE